MGDRFIPGDVWRHHSNMGKLLVASEQNNERPGYLKCYWIAGGNFTFLREDATTGFTLLSRKATPPPPPTEP